MCLAALWMPETLSDLNNKISVFTVPTFCWSGKDNKQLNKYTGNAPCVKKLYEENQSRVSWKEWMCVLFSIFLDQGSPF